MLRLLVGVAVMLVFALPSICFAQERIWKDSSGSFSVKAELIKVENGKVHLKRSDNGRIAAVPIIRLSDEDRAYLVDIAKPATSDDEPKPDDPKDDPDLDAPKPDDPKSGDPKSGEPKSGEPKSGEPKSGEPKSGEPKSGDPTPDEPGSDGPKSDDPKPDDPKPATGPGPANPPSAGDSPSTDVPASDPATPNMPADGPETNPDRPAEPPRNDSPKNDPPKFDPPKFDPPKFDPGNSGVGDSAKSPPTFVPSGSQAPKKMDAPVDNAAPLNNTSDSGANAEMNNPVEDAGDSGTPIDFSTIFDEKPEPVDPSQLSLEPIPVQSDWVGKTDQELIDSIDLSAAIRWKGNVRLSHLLEPRKPNYEIVITTPASELMSLATNVGHASFNRVIDSVDNEHQPVRLPPGIPNPVDGWIPMPGMSDSQPIKIGIEFGRPAKVPQRLKTVEGNIKLLFGIERQALMVSQIGETTGRIEHPVLSEEGLDIVIRRPDELTLVVEGSGKVNNLIGMKLVGEMPQSIGETQMSSSRSTFFQFNFLEPIPADLALAIEIVSASRELTLPFSFEDLEFRPGQAQGSVPRR